MKINRDYILKTFLDKIREAKRQGMKEIKIPIDFLDDVAYIIYGLMSEHISKILEYAEKQEKNESENNSSTLNGGSW